MSVYAGPADWWTDGTDAGRTHIATKGIVQANLVLNLDAGVSSSYSGSGNTWTDLSVSANTATLNASPSFTSSYGGGIVLNGTTQFANVTVINPFSETVSVWVSSATENWNQYGWISSSRRNNGHIIHPWLSTKQVYFYIYNSTGGSIYEIGIITPANIATPHMYTYSTNGTNLHKMYLDGILMVTNTALSITRTTTPVSTPLHIGKDESFARFGNGNLYNVTRYDRQLTDAEVLQNFNALRGRFGI